MLSVKVGAAPFMKQQTADFCKYRAGEQRIFWQIAQRIILFVKVKNVNNVDQKTKVI